MSQVFAWRPSRLATDEASDRFVRAMERRRARYEDVFRRTYRVRSSRVGDVWVASIATDEGVAGWNAWCEAEDRGIAWSGVCEDFLGGPVHADEVRSRAGELLEGSHSVADWLGGFSAVAWDRVEGEVCVTAGATQAQTLWWTEGPNGWAAGSRAAPLMDLVGRTARIDLDQASLYLAYGYQIGDGSLFEGVKRIASRDAIRFPQHGPPRVDTWISIPEYLARHPVDDTSVDAAVERCAAVLVDRVRRQAAASERPRLSLTGGRDSRAIAAALARIGFTGPAFTGGLEGHVDVDVAAEVASALGMRHEHESPVQDTFERMEGHRETLRTWAWLNEGTESVRHVMHYPHVFSGEAPPPNEQLFIGMQPGMNRLRIVNSSFQSLAERIGEHIIRREGAQTFSQELQERFERDARQAGGGDDTWRELYVWQVPGLRWAQDNHGAKEGLAWWWTPLMDPEIIRASWHLPRDHKFTNAFIEAVTVELAPELADVRYDQYPEPKRTTLTGRARKWARATAKRAGLGRKEPEAKEVHPFWNSFLFEREPRVWDRLLDPAYVRKTAAYYPEMRILWDVATLELLAEEIEAAAEPSTFVAAASVP